MGFVFLILQYFVDFFFYPLYFLSSIYAHWLPLYVKSFLWLFQLISTRCLVNGFYMSSHSLQPNDFIPIHSCRGHMDDEHVKCLCIFFLWEVRHLFRSNCDGLLNEQPHYVMIHFRLIYNPQTNTLKRKTSIQIWLLLTFRFHVTFTQ